jgi:hypothetical protein
MTKGKHLSEEHRRKDSESLRGEKNPFFGRKHSEKSKKKMRKAKKGKKKPQDIHKKLIIEQANNLIKEGYRCIITDLKPRPDIIAIKDGKIYAYEVEKGTHRPDLDKYKNNKDYDAIHWCVTQNYKPWLYEEKKINVIKLNGCVKNEHRRNRI